jgi:class 3 adenylate cyclase/tetratricopeptide (TPR) repeat protein
LNIPIPHSKTIHNKGELEGERRIATILFCDVQGSTAMADQLDPEEWAEIMDEAFDYMITPITRYQGTVARLMGDGILALFGAPLAHEDDPQRAVLAGLDILEGIQPFKKGIQRDYHMEFEIRIGINTGMVVVGEIGSDRAAEWTAMGDAVNLAARMQQTAQPGSLQVSEDTYRLVAPLFESEPLGGIEVKGKRGRLATYRILKAREQPGRLRGIPGLETPLTGRDREMESLRRALSQLSQGRGGIVCLLGDAGLGKTRLIEELHIEWQHQGNERCQWIEARGVAYDINRPYGLLRQLLLQSCGVKESEGPAYVRQNVLSVANTNLGLGDAASARPALALEVLLSVEKNDPAALDLDGEALKRQLFNEVSGLFRQLAAAAPLVLVGDDLQWADSASIELIVHLFQLSDEIPILFMCALRPYRQAAGWQTRQAAERDYPHRYTEVELQPLKEQESDTLVGGLLAVSDLPAELRSLINQKAEGNPFFVEEIVRNLIETGVLEHDRSGLKWHAAQRVNDIAIPDTIHALIAARIDRLEKDAHQTLQFASVIGRFFSYRLLKQISAAADPLDGRLNTLERMGLIWETERLPERKFAFRHELTREAAYESMLHRRRRQVHRLVGQAIESLYADQLESQSYILAMHYDKALDWEKALKYYTMAGDLAARLYATQEAVGHYEHAIQIALEIGTGDQLISLYRHLGRAMETSGRPQEAMDKYHELEALGHDRREPAMRLAALIPQATLRSIPSAVFNRKEGRKLSKRALALARRLGDYSAEARALWNMMLMEIMGSGDSIKGAVYGEEALDIARRNNLKEEQAYILNDLARVYLQIGRTSQAWVVHDEAQALWKELGNRAMLADSLGSESEARYACGEFEKAIQAGQAGLEISKAIDNPWSQAYNLMGMSIAYVEVGEIARSLQASQQACLLGHAAGFPAAEAMARFMISIVYGILGDALKGLELFQEMHDNPSGFASGFTAFGPLLNSGLAYYHLLNGDLAKARQFFDSVVMEIDLNTLDIILSPILCVYICEFSLASNDPAKALAYVEKVIAHRAPRSLLGFLPDLYQIKGRALRAMGQTEEGTGILETALRLSEESRSKRAMWSLLPTLLQVYQEQGDAFQAEVARQKASLLAKSFLDQIEDEPLRAKFLAKFGYLI